jgi:hypothetical protein
VCACVQTVANAKDRHKIDGPGFRHDPKSGEERPPADDTPAGFLFRSAEDMKARAAGPKRGAPFGGLKLAGHIGWPALFAVLQRAANMNEL